MKSPKNSPEETKSSVFFIIFISVILLSVIPCFYPNGVKAEEIEPVLNFYIERELFGHSDDVTALAWSSNGQMIASGSLDNTTKIWSTETWSTIKTLQHSAPVRGISCSKNTFKLAISHGNGTIEIWSSVTWTMIQTLSEHSDTVLGLSWSPDGAKLSTGDNSGNIKIWDATTWNSIETLGMPSGIKDIKWSNNGDKLAACSTNGTISVWDTTTWTSIESFDATAEDQNVESIAWNSDDTRLASSSGENKVEVWDTTSWEILQILNTESDPLKVLWSSDDTYVAVCVVGGLKIWDTTEWKVIKTTELTEVSQVAALTINPDGDKIASSAPSKTNNTVMIWEKNFSPVLNPIGNQIAIEDQIFTSTVSASDDDQLTFSDDSPLFDIDIVSGQIYFIPSNDDVGEHTITITAGDGKGGIDNETFSLTVINVDDPPIPVIKWRYGADYVNITLRVAGQIGSSVSLIVEESETPIEEVTVERESGILDEESTQLSMNISRFYEAALSYSGSMGQNPVTVTFERGGLVFTKHLIFDSKLGTEQTENLQMSDFFKAMGLIVYDATMSTDVDSTIVRYFWDFGDGDFDEGVNTVHSYCENGNYNVNLTVESDNGINRTLMIPISLNEIPDIETLESALSKELTLEYLESSNYRAVLLDGEKRLELVDGHGKTTGFSDGLYKFEIEGVFLTYSLNSGEVYYLPNDLRLTFNIADTEEAYELYLFIPNQGRAKIISIYGVSGGDSFELDEDGNSFTISTIEMEKEYSLLLEAEGDLGKGTFSLTDMKINSEDTHYYHINNWEDLTNDAKAVTLGIDKGSDGEIDHSIDLRNGMTGEQIEVIMSKGKSGPAFLTTTSLLLLVGFVSAAGIGCLIGSTEIGKLALLSLILPLYTRIKKEEVLDNEIRGMIRGYIIANPGDNYNSIKRALGLNNGALAYHLKVLERAELIKSKQDGMFRRFYPAGMRIPRENGGEISEIQRILLCEIAESPGINQKEIATLLGLSKGVINYHVKVLCGKRLLQMEKRGRKTHCYVNPEVLNKIKNTHGLK